MKNTRKIFAIIMAVVMCFSMLSVTAFATDNTITVYFDNNNVNWEMIVMLYGDAEEIHYSCGQMIEDSDGLFVGTLPAEAVTVRFQNYLPGTPEEYAPDEGFLSIEFTDVEDGRVYTYEAADTDGYELWVGGVQVTEDNADDILGDGTARYNPDTNELYLDGLDITECYPMNEYINVGIFAAQDLNIVLADGSENTISIPANEATYGIAVEGSLYISGDGALSVFCNDVDGEYEYAYSYGVYATGGMCVEGASVYARGGDLNVTEYGQSTGVHTYGDVSVDFDGTLIAEGGNVTSDYVAYSDGITAMSDNIIYDSDDEDIQEYINVSVYEGYLEATSGNTTSGYYAMSSGLYFESAGVYTYDKNSALVVNSGNATVPETENTRAISAGIVINKGDAGFYAGDISVSTGEVAGFEAIAYGIFATAYEDEDGSFSGGYVSVYCDEVTPGEHSPGLVGTKLNVSSPDGIAIIAQMGIEIGEELTIVNPENAEVTEHDDIFGTVGYTVFNEDGSMAENVTIEPLGYKVTINGLNNGMAAKVPAGMSLNEFYCDFFGIEDFSEVINTEKEGYTFGGFYTDEACTDGNEFSFDDEITGDVTIYAKWIENADDNEQGGNEQGSTNTDNNNQNTDKEENKQPVADPEIPNTDATDSNALFAILLVSAFGIVLIMNSNKKRVFSK